MSLVAEVKRRKQASGDDEKFPRKKVSPEVKAKLVASLKKNRPPIKDEEFHEKADELGVNPHSAEEAMYGIVKKEALDWKAMLASMKKRRMDKKAQMGVPAMMVRPTVSDQVARVVENLVKTKQIHSSQAEEVAKMLMEQADPEIKAQETKAFRQEAKETAYAPSTMVGTAGAAASLAAFPWLLSRASWLLGRRPKDPMTLGRSLKFNFLPAFLPFSAGFEGLSHALAPLSDPQRKERGYFGSVGESFRGAQEGLAERGAEARARYGLAGIPLQMFHGVMNPLASMAYLGRSIGNTFTKPNIKEWAEEAARNRDEMLTP